MLTYCNGGQLFGYEKYIYSGQVTLPPSNWTMSYTSCCRNVSNTITNSMSVNWYLYFNLNNQLAPGNQPPYFTADPVAIIKLNSNFHYNHGVFDPDGDSVTIKLVEPMQAAGTPVIYFPAYTAQQFIASNPPIFEDQVNGDLIIHPSQLQIGVYAVEVIEWDTDSVTPVMVSKQIRDMWIQVINDPTGVPVLSGINPLAAAYSPNDTIYHISVMAGDTIDFGIYPNQQSPPANLTLSYPKQIPGATHTINQNGTPNATGHFFWVPTSTQIVQGPAVFLTQLMDDRCPYYNYQVYSYSFDVGGLIVFLLPGGPANLQLGQSYTLTANCPAAITFDWYVNGIMVQSGAAQSYTFMSQDLGPGDHTVGCKAYGTSKSVPQHGFEFVNVHIENVWGIENLAEDKVGIYPNPAKDKLIIQTELPITSLKLFDLQGRMIESYAAQTKQIEVGQLSRGVYMLSINGHINRKIVLE
jgi:hypothetical protein